MDVRPITLDEHASFMGTFTRAMGFPPFGEDALERLRSEFRPERSLAAVDRDQFVASAYSHLFELTLPGGVQMGVAGVTSVGVLATHRRRGLLSEIMRRQLAEARERGEAAAILIASESIIYGRFGYGPSSYLFDYEIDPRDGSYQEPFDDRGVHFVDESTADKVFPDLHERFRKMQPGAVPRTQMWWAGVLADRKPGDAHVLYEDPSGNPDGYARYHVASKWDAGLPASEIHVRDLIATTPEASRALWRHLLDVDLIRKVQVWARPVDEPVRWWLANPRALKVTRCGDLIWTRILDIPLSLAARRYRADVELVLEVTDPLFDDNDSRFALVIDGGVATCEPTQAPADLALGVSALGSLYLGGVAASDLARGGRVREVSEGALAKADAAFASTPKPWSATWF